jgi:hypothetical protein
MPQQTVAAFDLGIKNLSYCVATVDGSGGLVAIHRWANLNLLADGAESQAQTRCGCGGPASWIDATVIKLLCKKCAKKYPKLALDISGSSLAAWRSWAPGALCISETEAKKLSKASLMTRAGAIRLMPYKAPKSKGVTLQTLLASMEKCLDAELVHLAAADRIRLENQPSEFAPHMKSIQIMLFTLLDHRLRVEKGWVGRMEFVNASVKTRGCAGAGVGKEAKRSRKLAGIQRVIAALTSLPTAGVTAGVTTGVTTGYQAWFAGQAKQDDLADALLMCLDAGVVQTSS